MQIVDVHCSVTDIIMSLVDHCQAVRYLMRFQTEYTCNLLNAARHAAFGWEAAKLVLATTVEGWPEDVVRDKGRTEMEEYVWSNHKPWMPRPLLSMHVRMGDKACEMKVVEFEDYMLLAHRIRARFPQLNTIWLSTEMQEVVDKSKSYPHWNFYYTNVTRQVGNMTMATYESSLGRETSTNYPLMNFLMAADADFFIGALGSTWCFLIDGMRNTGGKVLAGYLSVNKDRFCNPMLTRSTLTGGLRIYWGLGTACPIYIGRRVENIAGFGYSQGVSWRLLKRAPKKVEEGALRESYGDPEPDLDLEPKELRAKATVVLDLKSREGHPCTKRKVSKVDTIVNRLKGKNKKANSVQGQKVRHGEPRKLSFPCRGGVKDTMYEPVPPNQPYYCLSMDAIEGSMYVSAPVSTVGDDIGSTSYTQTGMGQKVRQGEPRKLSFPCRGGVQDTMYEPVSPNQPYYCPSMDAIEDSMLTYMSHLTVLQALSKNCHNAVEHGPFILKVYLRFAVAGYRSPSSFVVHRLVVLRPPSRLPSSIVSSFFVLLQETASAQFGVQVPFFLGKLNSFNMASLFAHSGNISIAVLSWDLGANLCNAGNLWAFFCFALYSRTFLRSSKRVE
ncbi:hypothetical protein TEA_027470 [Camellia sinensis var. sinensis]|uniref:Uncharacterized protein n=1 Tax=Camellia sinensis var. sinensis TaxID=542762 RepID=A0A4S4EA89_CAMSN|nr:hypothetical protein TEA_027470 [Camellia sinensis var. sinensis]